MYGLLGKDYIYIYIYAFSRSFYPKRFTFVLLVWKDYI